jgi:hypothetical protein
MTVFPSGHSDPIRCTLQITDIEHAPRFEALSYVWGRDRSDIPLICDNATLIITMNLDRALRHLRWPDRPRRLWVDAVCINQESLEERSRQVQYMRLIYKHASTVVAWLGPKSPGVEQAFEFATNISQLRNDQYSEASSGVDTVSRNPWVYPEVYEIMLSLFNSQPESADFLTQLFDKDYFERVWCIQEVVASAHCLVKCGDLQIDFFTLLATATYVEGRRGFTFPPSTLQFWTAALQSRLRRVASPRRWDINGSMGKLLTLLMAIRDFKATDERDRIFAILGISDEGLEPVIALTQIYGDEESLILNLARRFGVWLTNKAKGIGPGIDPLRNSALIPNYEKSVKDVYRDLTRFLICISPRVLDVLGHVQHTVDPSYPNQDSWPSWVPKWYEPRSVSVFSFEPFKAGIPLEGHYPYFAKAYDLTLSGKSQEPDCLKLDGFHVDQVEAVSSIIRFGMGEEPPVESIWNGIFDFPLFPRPNIPYMANEGEALDVAFFTTLNLGVLGGAQMAQAHLQTLPNSNGVAVEVLTRHVRANIATWLSQYPRARGDSYPELNTAVQENPRIGYPEAFLRSVWAFCVNRRFYRTSSGLIGVGPQIMRQGDQVYVLLGGRLPFILRSGEDHYLFIGETYLHHEDILKGQEVMSVRSTKEGKSRIETLKLR